MKKGFLLILWAALLLPVWGQVSPAQNLNKHKDLPKIYDEKADAMSQIDQALEDARESGRFVICQVGGNWCPWCLRFADFISNDTTISQVIAENFICSIFYFFRSFLSVFLPLIQVHRSKNFRFHSCKEAR